MSHADGVYFAKRDDAEPKKLVIRIYTRQDGVQCVEGFGWLKHPTLRDYLRVATIIKPVEFPNEA